VCKQLCDSCCSRRRLAHHYPLAYVPESGCPADDISTLESRTTSDTTPLRPTRRSARPIAERSASRSPTLPARTRTIRHADRRSRIRFRNLRPGDVNYSFRNGSPTQITQSRRPTGPSTAPGRHGLYFQDHGPFAADDELWRRFDYFNGHVARTTSRRRPPGGCPRVILPPSPACPPEGLQPLFGARTTVRQRQTAAEGVDWPLRREDGNGGGEREQPVTDVGPTASRGAWGDNGNFVPDCDLRNRAANGECGPMSTQLRRPQPNHSLEVTDVLRGWGVRNSNWDVGVSEIQRRAGSGVSLRRLLPELVRQLHPTRTTCSGSRPIRLVLRHRALNPNLPGGAASGLRMQTCRSRNSRRWITCHAVLTLRHQKLVNTS